MITDVTLGRPIQSIQTLLRRISASDTDIPPVIPDGIFGEQTEASVIAFRTKYGPQPPSGEIDYETWLQIIAVHDDIVFAQASPQAINLFPEDLVITPGSNSVHLLPIQGMLAVLADTFPQFSSGTISGIHDDGSVQTIKQLQKIFGIPENGTIDKTFWRQFVPFYETHIVSGKNAAAE